MGHREEILALVLTRPGLTDAQIRQLTGINPHQQVNQICRSLEVEGLTRREVGRDGYIVNLPARQLERPSATAVTPALPESRVVEVPPQTARVTVSAGPGVAAPAPGALVVTACSKAKRPAGVEALEHRTILDALPGDLARELREARARNATAVGLNETRLMPAVDRYSGYLYEQGRGAIRRLLSRQCEVLILSGGYGIVRAEEAIGLYDCRFDPSMWGGRLVERCLRAIASETPAREVIGVLSGSSTYAAAFRGTNWPAGWRVSLVTPERAPGAQVRAPRAQGEALRALAIGGIPSGWTSSDGLGVEVEDLGR